MSLPRLWRDQGKPQQACELLAPIYCWFTEGFDTLDLKEAKALQEQLVGQIIMSPLGLKRISVPWATMSAFGGEADIASYLAMSANDPERTCAPNAPFT
jgi:hypothetical protein